MKKLILAFILLGCTSLFASTTDSLSVRTNTSETLFNNLAKPDSQTNAVVNVHLKPIMQKAIEAQKAGNSNETQRGYRVQLFSSNNAQRARGDAFNVEKTILDKMPNLPVYVTYTSPFWKVRVGNCVTHAEAQTLRQFLIENFPEFQTETYIVPDQIVVNQ